MNGAESLIRTAADAGVTVCFANPGTTEMDLVTAMDRVGPMRPIMCLFEGVCSAAADGYARMADTPAICLLHLGPGLGNGVANLHNAKRARTPLINLIGEHSTWHVEHDPPLASDIESIAGPVSGWVGRCDSADKMGGWMARAIEAAQGPPGTVATLIAPADLCAATSGGPAQASSPPPPAAVESETIEGIVETLRSAERAALFLGDAACREPGLRAAHRIAAATGCKLFYETFVQRIERGAGLPPVTRLPYFPDAALEALAGVKTLVLAGSRPPVSFFGYPGYPSILMPEGCEAVALAKPGEDIIGALESVADALDAPGNPGGLIERAAPVRPTGELTPEKVGHALAALIPEIAIVSDEALSPGPPIHALTHFAAPHTMIYLTGGAIGQGLPVSTGAAVACPDRPVVAIESDGCALYTLQALWTQAREGLDVTTVILSNRAYAILQVELERSGLTELGPKTQALTELRRPDLDWTAISKGFGVPAERAETGEELWLALERAFAESGPHLIEAIIG